MKPKSFMLIAGEASGDLLASELVSALRDALASDPQSAIRNPQFFGAGGPKMSAAGVELAVDMTQHSVIGISDVLKNVFKFRRLFNQLLALAIERKPDAVIGVDYGGFNLRFGHAVKEYVRRNPAANWDPKIVQFVSPQVWASRPGRAGRLAADYDLLLSIFPFEKDWYARHAPKLRVEFVGHPMVGRFSVGTPRRGVQTAQRAVPTILLLPGSRKSELQRHLPVILAALKLIQAKSQNIKAIMVLPDENLLDELIWNLAGQISNVIRSERPIASSLTGKLANDLAQKFLPGFEIRIGNLPEALAQTDVAIASTGTVTMECAYFGVPAVTLYKTSWLTYEIGRRIVTVKTLTMPNLLAGEEVYPEFVQGAATAKNIAGAALELLGDESRRAKIKSQLANIVSSLGGPGATMRAADAILGLFGATDLHR